MRLLTLILTLLIHFNVSAAYNYKNYPWTTSGEKLTAYAFVNKTTLLRNAKAMYPRYLKYAPKIRIIAKKYKVPLEIATLAAIESGFNPKAVSPAGAVGMWQFMKPTAIEYGLQVSNEIDQRLDWELSTVAAVKYIKWLAESKFGGDYETAIMSYNFGIGNVRKVIKKAKTSNAWTLINASLVPVETEEHLIRFLIYTQIFKHLDLSWE